MGLRAYSMTPGATRLSKLVGCALSLSVFSLWLQSLHAARKGLPHRHHVVQLAGARQPAAAQCALAVLRGQGLLPLRRAGHFPLRLQQLQKNLVRQAGQALAPVLLVERLVLLRQLSDPGAPPQPQPAVLRRAADGHLGALADGHAASPPAGPRTRTWMGGRVCLASPR